MSARDAIKARRGGSVTSPNITNVEAKRVIRIVFVMCSSILRSPMSNPFISKLRCGADLSLEDRKVLEQVTSAPRKLRAHERIIDEGDRPDKVHLVLEGYACRAKTLPGGERQIMALLLPGDFCDLHIAILDEMDHAIRTLTSCKVVHIPRHTVEHLIRSSPAITRALWWATLVDEATLREWLVNMGRRPAEQQMAHLFCELLVRLRVVGLTQGDSYDLPFTQEELADILGLSVVHVNRVLQRLRGERLVEWSQGRMRIPDYERLSAFATFNPNYLHLRGDAAALTAHG